MSTLQHTDGPSQVIPATKYHVTSIDEPVKLRIPENGTDIETLPPISIPEFLHNTVSTSPDHAAICYQSSTAVWETITYSEYEDQVRTCAKAFLHLGLRRHNSVCILGYNSPEWFISSLGAIFAGGISVGIYITNSSSACLHCAILNTTNIFVVQDETHLEKILKIKHQLPDLRAIIQYEGIPQSQNVLSWKELMKIGRAQNDFVLNKTLGQIAVNECCVIIYTSGTVGEPKAVMISHDNLTWSAACLSQYLGAKRKQDRIISYLPLSHIAGQAFDIYTSIFLTATTYIADKNALKGTLANTMKYVQPTIFFGVPRVWEKIYERITQMNLESGFIKKKILNWALRMGYQHNLNKINKIESRSIGFSVAHHLVLRKIKYALGLNSCFLVASGAAPISKEIKYFFLRLDIYLGEVFGSSEASGVHTFNFSSNHPIESIGTTMAGMKTRMLRFDDTSSEICLYGRHIFMGYLKDVQKTLEVFDTEGWMHSGDLGYIDENGMVYITGREKELIITAGGENIPPVLIEQAVRAELPPISNAIVIGDKKKFLSILISLKTNINSEGTPLDTLSNEVKEWLQGLGCPADTLTEILKAGPDKKLLEAIDAGIQRVNKKAISRAQHIQKFAILPADFSIATGELGPTLKLKRNFIVVKYNDTINSLYE